ncbi:MAG TPA: carboxypeptidase regulatory-like domain-containing protein [Bryobacteraceae bacterium]|nr:carboxypeptidase regulatory-like domain-containing protein [Bryobacteraceae bacterium]
MRSLRNFLLLIACAALALSQVTSRLDGTVTDPQGAAVVGAQVRVSNAATGQNFEIKSDERGYWIVASLPTGIYKVTVSLQGFKTDVLDNIKLDAGVPATVNSTLQIGSLTETVEVQGGAEVLQTGTATLTSTLVGRQLHELPFTSRNITELIVTQPGSATPGVPRSTSVYGLPQSALNTTLDGINIQDNSNRSSDGFFLGIFPRAEAIEEMTIVGAAAGADSNGEGALQMKLVTRNGTNEFHGGLFEQHRNQFFNANYYYNNLQGFPRDHVVFNQFGGLIGGPIKKNKLFFFGHVEILRLPQTYTEPTGTVLTPEAIAGNFRYRDTAGTVRTVNVLQLAGAANFVSTPDPIVAKALSQIAGLTNGFPGLKSRIASNTDYNRNNIDFLSKGGNYRKFPTFRLDYNVTSKHHLEFIYNYQTNLRSPDGVNVGTASPIFPGTGNVLNGTVDGNQGGIAFSGVGAVRSTITPRLTSEIRFGLTGGTVIFNNGIGAPDFLQFNGFAPNFNFVTSPFRTTGQTRRNTPLKQLNGNLSYSRGVHLYNFGGSFTQVNTWSSSANNSQFTPGVTFSLAAGDPVTTALFNATNFPGSNATNQGDAGALYALLTGRVSSITRNVILDADTKKYGAFQPVVKNRQRESGIFVQDSWRVRPNLTFNYGIRLDLQAPPINLNGVYTRVGYAGAWGISGVGNLFMPGTLTGKTPEYRQITDGETGFDLHPLYAPSVGLAWVLPKSSFKPLGWLIGRDGESVLRAGYSINSVREDGSTFSVWNTNQGRTVSLSVDPAGFPTIFGAPGSVLFRNPLPSRAIPEPSFPLQLQPNNSVAEFDPNLRTGYVQSWNFGFQRQLTKDTVMEVRYVGNHGTGLWRNININEINIIENGFLNEFKIAQANLVLARQTTPNSNVYAGLAGQQPLPIISLSVGANNDTTVATQIAQGQAGSLANAIATNTTRMNRLIAAGRPVNFFEVNPLAGGTGSATILQNAGHTHYNGLQTEVRRRMSKGLLFQGSYTWSHSTGNEFTNGIAGSFTTARNQSLDNGPSPYDIRHALKMNWIYELPFGAKRHFLNGHYNVFARKALEGWQIASVTRIQSGTPIRLTSNRGTFNQNEPGVVLHNITASELQDMMQIRKTTNAQGQGVVYYLPQSIIDNTLAGYDLLPGRTLDKNAPYISAPEAGQMGNRAFLYGPRQQKWDVSVGKKTMIGERANVEFRAQAINVFNLQNFLLFVPGNGITTNLNTNASGFGQLANNSSYRDLSNTNDTGGRIIEFVLKFNF